MKIYKKLYNVTNKIGKMKKDTTNPFYGNKYFDINQLIESVRPALIEEDLLLLQPIRDNNVGTVIIDVETGESVESFLPLPDISDPQKVGSVITYFRRYTLQSLLGIEAEDDDGNRTVPENKRQEYMNRPWLNEGTPEWDKCEEYVKGGGNPKDLYRKYQISNANMDYFKKLKL